MQALRVSTGSVITLSQALVATVVEDGAVLLDLQSKYFYSLNASAWAIVQLFETSGAGIDRILEQCRKWGASDETQIQAFLAQLAGENLVEEASEGGQPVEPQFAGTWHAPVLTRHAQPLQNIVTSAFDPSIPLAE